MDEEDEKKKQKRNWGSTIANIIKMVRRLANPVIFWTVIISLIIVIIIGFISYFKSIPSAVLGKISKWLNDASNLLAEIFYDGKIKANEGEILDLCKYLEEMGYDVEGYGFVETIQRENDPEYNDDTSNNITTRGEIKSVTSKYLEAYVISEKKVYAVSNPERRYEANKILAAHRRNVLQLAISDAISNSSDEIKAKIEQIEEQKGYTRADTVHYLTVFYASTTSLYEEEPDIWTYIGSVILPWISTETSDCRKGTEIFDSLDEGMKDPFNGLVFTFVEKYKTEYSEYKYIGDGLIVLEGPITDSDFKGDYFSTFGWWYYKVKEANGDHGGYQVDIDAKQRYFYVIQNIPSGTLLDVLKLGRVSKYGFDLNNWTVKYGKPIEFLVAVHAATMAPDFTYQLATSTAVDTKVHVDLFETDFDIGVVEEDKNEDYVKTALTSANEDAVILNLLKLKMKEIIEETYKDKFTSDINETYKRIIEKGPTYKFLRIKIL